MLNILINKKYKVTRNDHRCVCMRYYTSCIFTALSLSLLPSGSPFGDPGPHGDLFQFLGPQKVPIFFQGPHFLYFRLKNALKVRASAIILVICILKGEFSETHLFNENGANLCTHEATFCEDVFP